MTIDTEQAAERVQPEGDDWVTVCSCGGDPDTCEANQAVIAQTAADEAAENRTEVCPS